ncbi:unnamed protein product [Mytilus edulis]|uniref:THAP-type domain-containing protein n=1 Tax=Mytilus edulis TaxID=6550 RepID=A0A8S3ULP6_MYTED|nr:unnamed protein product [Mytilus edulis]
MGKVCIVLGCRNRDSHKQPGIKFHRIPKDEGRKELWIRAINRRDPVTGKVWISGDEGARFIETLSLFCNRYKRAVKRTADQKERECRIQLDFLMTADGKENDHLPLQDLDCNVELEDKNGTGEFENYRILFENAISENRILIDRLQQLQFENNVIKNKPPYIRATSLSLEKTEETTKFYTGLPSYSCFMWLVNFVTYKIISLKSGYLDFINHGDVVLADRGFLIRDELASRGAELIIPSFVKGKDQLSAFEVERSRNIAHVRIHVEREMERLKNFRILSGKMSMNMVPHSDSIMTICSAIINMHPNIVQ